MNRDTHTHIHIISYVLIHCCMPAVETGKKNATSCSNYATRIKTIGFHFVVDILCMYVYML